MNRGRVFELVKILLDHKAEVTGPDKVGPVLLKYGVSPAELEEFYGMSLLDALANINLRELLLMAVSSEGL